MGEKSCIGFAFGDIKHTTMFPSDVKTQILPQIIDKSKVNKKKAAACMHSVGLHDCLKDTLSSVPGVIICADGHNPGDLKHYLKLLFGRDYDEEKIMIVSSLKPYAGKRNPAHILAYNTLKGRRRKRPTTVLTEKDFRRFVGRKGRQR